MQQIKENITYDGYGEIVKTNQSFLGKKSASTLFQQEFTRDHLGRVVSVTQASVNFFDPRRIDYAYDLQGRLIKVFENQRLKVEYKYDANGNRVQKILGSPERKLASDHDENRIQATYDEQDRLVKYGRNVYEYNRNGELQQKTELAEDKDEDDRGRFSLKEFLEKLYAKLHGKNQKRNKVTKYSYNSFGQLKTVTLPDQTVIEYILSADGRRLGKKVNGVLSRRYVFQNQTQLAAELDESGAILKQFIYATKSNVPDYMIYKGTAYKIISDQVGTPKLVVNANTGKVVEMLAFDEFGAKNTEGCFLDLLSFLDKGSRDRFKKEGSLLPFGFAGGLRDEDTGLMHFGAREYDPETGRWTTKDPIGFGGGDTNLYGYVGGNPISYTDPTGHFAAIDDALYAIVGAGIMTGLSSVYGTYHAGDHSVRGLASSFSTGFISGAGSALALVSGWGIALSTGIGIGSQILFNTDMFSQDNMRDYMNGLSVIRTNAQNNLKKKNPICEKN